MAENLERDAAADEPARDADHGHGAERQRFEVDPHFVTLVTGAAYDRDAPELRRLLKGMHPADLADVVEQIPDEALKRLFRLIGPELPSAFLADVEWETREKVLELLPADYVGRALGELDTDDAAAVAADLDEDKLEQALAAADDETRLAVEQGLAAEEDTAGRLMQRELVAAPEFWSVGDAIDHMRSEETELPETFFELYVVDPGFRPIGAVPLSTLLKTPRDVAIDKIMTEDLTVIPVSMDQEDVAYKFEQYNLISAPVVDEADRLVGMITVDDVVEIVHAESHEDMLALGGVESDAGLTDSVVETVRSRFSWLAVNLATAIMASLVISLFDKAIEQVVALAVLMPIVASMGGNAGTQTLTVAVRSLATKDLSASNAARIIWRETIVGGLNGILFALIMGALAGLWHASAGASADQAVRLAIVIGAAMIINLLAAGLAGILVPLGLQRAGADPAVSSAVFVTTVTDIVGFFVFLGLAALVLM